METTSLKVVPDENPAAFLNRLTEAFTTYTRIAPDSPVGVTTLANHFISQSAPDIRKNFPRLMMGLRHLVKMAFKVYNAREEATEASRKARLKQKAKLQANLLERHTPALVAALWPATGQKVGPQKPPPGACFR